MRRLLLLLALLITVPVAQAQRLKGQARLDSINAAYYAHNVVPVQPSNVSSIEALRLKEQAQSRKKARLDSINAAFYARNVTPLEQPKSSSTDILVGPRGGLYRINKNGNKTYLKRK